MLEIGETDGFERRYTQKFRTLAGEFGEFVAYERDRAARDIGIHLTHKLASGKERVTSSLCWFQLKGIMASTASVAAHEGTGYVALSLKTRHLQYWFLQPMPTYLALYLEASDKFLAVNLQSYVEQEWGRGIMSREEKSLTVKVPLASVLDRQYFSLILAENEREEWVKAIAGTPASIRLCQRDYHIIWCVGTAGDRNVYHRLRVVDWQSKTRGEVYVLEFDEVGAEPRIIRQHFQYMLSIESVEPTYPYLSLAAPLDALSEEDHMWDDEGEVLPKWRLASGQVVYGENCADEYFEFVADLSLNTLGEEIFGQVELLRTYGLLNIDPDAAQAISIAPWHHRSV